MKYKIVITFPELKTAEKVFDMIRASEVYHSEEIMQLHSIKEVCDECADKE